MISASYFFCLDIKVFVFHLAWEDLLYCLFPFTVFRVEEILEQADYLYESGETEKLYQLLTQYKERWAMYDRPGFAVSSEILLLN